MAIFRGKTVEEAIEKGLEHMNVPKEKVHILVLQAPTKGLFGFGVKEAQVKMELIDERVVQQADRAAVRGIPDDIIAQAEPVKSAQEETVELSQVIAEVKKVQAEKEQISDLGTKDSDVNTHPVKLDMNASIVDKLVVYLERITKELGSQANVRVEHAGATIYFHLDSEKQGLLIGKHGKTLNALQYLSQIFVHRLFNGKVTIIVDVGDYRLKRKEVLSRLAKKTAERVKETGQPVFLEPMPSFERKQIHYTLTSDPYIKTYSEGDDPFRYLVVEHSGKQI
jgi:spoIIIJ-associated protein